MVCEGISLLIKTSKFSLYIHGRHPNRQKIIYACLGWGTPVIIVVAAVLSASNPGKEYMDTLMKEPVIYRMCWLSVESLTVVYSVVIPFAVMLFINLLITVRAGYFVYSLSKSSDYLKPHEFKPGGSGLMHVLSSLRAVVMLMPALGLPWIFAFFISKY